MKPVWIAFITGLFVGANLGILVIALMYAAKRGDIVEQKNKAYGDSFAKSGEFMRLLYPAGIHPDQYEDMLGLVRVFDKQMRIATDKDALGENPWGDIAGYGILGVARKGGAQ